MLTYHQHIWLEPFSLQAYEVNDQLDIMADKLQYPHDDLPPKMSPPYRGEEHLPSWVQQGVDYVQHLWAWEPRQPLVQQQHSHSAVGLDRRQIEAIVRAAVQKQLSDLGVQAGVTGTGSNDARFVSTHVTNSSFIFDLTMLTTIVVKLAFKYNIGPNFCRIQLYSAQIVDHNILTPTLFLLML